MTAGVKVENVSSIPTTPISGVVCHPKDRTRYRLVYLFAKYETLTSSVPGISLGAAKFEMGYVTLITPLLRVIGHPYART